MNVTCARCGNDFPTIEPQDPPAFLFQTRDGRWVCHRCVAESALSQPELTLDEQRQAMRLLQYAYGALSAATRRAFPLMDDWPKECDEAYRAIADFLWPDEGDGLLGRKWGET